MSMWPLIKKSHQARQIRL